MEETVREPSDRKTIGTVQLAVIIFYAVSGGPFGIEEAIQAGGVFYALLGFLLMPLVWSLPEALITAELGAAYPEASGTVAWVEEAYGPFWGWLQGCLTWVSGATDNAIYPVLFLDYLFQVLGVADDMSFWVRFALLSGICLSLAYINYRGLDLVSELSLTVCFLSMSPFIVFFFVAIPKIDPSRWLQKPDMEALMNSTLYKEELDKENGLFPNGGVFRGILLAPFLNSLFWNLNSFDSAACFASEIENPGHSFPRAMFVAVIFVVVGYMIPILTATGTTDASQDKWVDGYMGTVAEEAVGPWLGGWVVFAAGIANLAMFLAEMSSDAFQILGLAERGYLPKIFSQRSRYGTPTYGILVGTCVILAMSVSNLSSLIELLNFNYALSLLLEYSAFIWLRIKKPNLVRPYRIPANTFGCILLLTPTFFFTILVMLLASYTTYAYALGTVCVALIIYRLRRSKPCSKDYSVVAQAEKDVEINGSGSVLAVLSPVDPQHVPLEESDPPPTPLIV